LYELEMGDKAEELSEMEMDMGDDSIMMSVKAFYYNPSNSRAENNQNTITLIGDVNLEAPYHRSGNMDDYKEITFTFNSKKELEDKMSENMEHIIDWFGGDGYSESTREMKVRRMAKGGDISDKQYLDSLAEERFKLGRARRIERIGNIHEYLANYKTPSEKRYFDVFDKKLNKILAQNNASFIDDVSDIREIAKLERLYDKLILQDIRGYAQGGEIDSFSEYQVFYNDEEMIKVFKDKSSQDAYNVSYFGLLENDELPSVIDEVLNNRRKLSKSESEDLYRKLKGKRGIEIRNVVDGKSTDKRGKKIITPSEFRKILKDLGFKVSFKRNSLGVFAIVKDSEGKELPTIFMGEEHRKKWLPVIELKKQYSIEKDYEKVFFAKGGEVNMPLYRLSVVDESGRESYDYSSKSKSDAEKIFNEYKSDGIEVALEKRVGKKDNYEYETIKSFDTEDDDYAKGGSMASGGTLYEKATQKRYLEKYAKNGNLIRTAEQFDSGSWVVSEYPPSKTNLQGEYTNEEFDKIRKYF